MKYAAFILMAALVLSACTATTVPTTPTQPGNTVSVFEVQTPQELVQPKELTAFISEDEFKEALTITNLGYGGIARSFGMEGSTTFFAMDAAAESAPSAAPTLKQISTEYSETNNQVQGVDEQDLIKTDGEFIYTFSGNTLFIATAWPAEDLDVIARVDLEDLSPSGIFVQDDRLVVLGYQSQRYDTKRRFILPQWGNTGVRVFDISNREDPQEVDRFTLDGNFNTARMKDDHVYVMTTRYSYGGVPELPIILRGDVSTTIPADRIWYYPYHYSSPQLSMAYSFDIDNSEDIESVGVVTESGAQVYMSDENIYFASAEWVDRHVLLMESTVAVIKPSLDADQRNLLERIEQVDSDILSDNEKLQRMMQVIEQYTSSLTADQVELLEEETKNAYEARLAEYEYFTYTIISRVSYEDGSMSVEASGKVPGSVHNQFAMDEHATSNGRNVLRVATTVDQFNDWTLDIEEESHSIVTTLDEDMEVLDQVKGIAKGERIFSTRYVDNTLYMVTFRQVDPFFVIDLEDPKNIDIVGELKIPGFSRYLHPVSEDVILGLGRDATLEGRQEGLKISLFDVSNPSNPKEIDSWVADGKYTGSDAEFDHHAFLFSASKELLVLPVNKYDYQNDDYFNGVFVFKVTEDAVELTGDLQHGTGNRYDYQSRIERSVYIDDVLFTKSYGRLVASELSTLDEIEIAVLKVFDNDYREYPVFFEDDMEVELINDIMVASEPAPNSAREE